KFSTEEQAGRQGSQLSRPRQPPRRQPMRIHRYLLSALIAVCASSAFANTEVKFALDWRFEGPAAPYLVALDKGYYKDEGLNVTIDAGASSVEPINRVATATYHIGFADINSLIKYRD